MFACNWQTGKNWQAIVCFGFSLTNCGCVSVLVLHDCRIIFHLMAICSHAASILITLYHISNFFAGTQFTASAPVSPRYAATSKLQMTSCSSGLTKKPPLRELGCWELLSQKLSLSTLTCRMSIRTISSNSMTHFLEQVCRFYILLHVCTLLHIGPAAVYYKEIVHESSRE